MPESQDVRQARQKQLCNAETFLHYVRVEIERYTRYNRAFTIVLIQPPASGSHQTRPQLTRTAPGRVLALPRTSDLLTFFENSAFVIALLPETDAVGARIVFDRFAEHLVRPGVAWMLKMATYPEHSGSIEHFLERFSGLLRSSDFKTERYGYLRQVTTDVSRSWRDLPSAQ